MTDDTLKFPRDVPKKRCHKIRVKLRPLLDQLSFRAQHAKFLSHKLQPAACCLEKCSAIVVFPVRRNRIGLVKLGGAKFKRQTSGFGRCRSMGSVRHSLQGL